jgi:hypothetical protein
VVDELAVSVRVVEAPSLLVEVLLSDGAVGLTPPPPIGVEMPPVARSLTLVGPIVVIEVEVDAGDPGLAGAAAESLELTPVEECAGATSAGGDSAGAVSLDGATGAETRTGVAGRACATTAGRAWEWWGDGAGSACWSSTAPPAVTTAAASRVATCPAPALSVPTETTAVEVPAAPPAAMAPPAAPPPIPPTPSRLASTPSGPSVGTIAANRRLTPRS